MHVRELGVIPPHSPRSLLTRGIIIQSATGVHGVLSITGPDPLIYTSAESRQIRQSTRMLM